MNLGQVGLGILRAKAAQESPAVNLTAQVEALRTRRLSVEASGESVRRIYLSRAFYEAILRDRELSSRIGPAAPEPIVFLGVPCIVTQLLDDLGRHWWVSSHVGP